MCESRWRSQKGKSGTFGFETLHCTLKKSKNHISPDSPLLTGSYDGRRHRHCLQTTPFWTLQNLVDKLCLNQLNTRLFIFNWKSRSGFLLNFSSRLLCQGMELCIQCKNQSAGTQYEMGIIQWLWVRRRKWIRERFVGVPMSTKNKKFHSSYVGYARSTSLVQSSTIPFKMCHMLIGNPTLISSFFYTKIDSAVPYNSAGHWAILNIQYIAMRAKRNFSQVWMIPKRVHAQVRSLHQAGTLTAVHLHQAAGKSTDALMPFKLILCAAFPIP